MSEDFTTLQMLRFMNLQPKLSGRQRSDRKKQPTIKLEIVNFWANCNSKTWIKDILGNKILNNHHKFGNFPTGEICPGWYVAESDLWCLASCSACWRSNSWNSRIRSRRRERSWLAWCWWWWNGWHDFLEATFLGKKCGVMTSVVFSIYKNSQGMCKETFTVSIWGDKCFLSAPKIPVDPFEKWNVHPKCWGDDWGILGGDPELKWIKKPPDSQTPKVLWRNFKEPPKNGFQSIVKTMVKHYDKPW